MADISAVKEITEKLETGVKELFESDKYAAYLRTMGRFHHYSTRNTLLIYMQLPTASKCAGYQSWKNNFNRQVKKGEKGIKIFAPMPFLVKEELEKLDPVTKQPIIGEDGRPVMEEYIKMQSARFKIVSVFDVSQTEGEPLPELAETLTGDVARYGLFMDALRAISPLPIVFEDLPPDTDGKCVFGDRIAVRSGMSEIQTVSAAIHEICHAKLDDASVVKENGGKPKDRRTSEIIAESVSFCVSNFFNIETGANSLGYVLDWSKTKELKELNASLDTIRKTAAELIDGIDKQCLALAKERGIDLSAVTDGLGAEQNYNMIDGVINNVPPVPYQSPEKPPSETSERAGASNETRHIGETVLMPLLYEDGSLNRDGKRTRVKVEPPIGKYAVYSRETGKPPYASNEAYLMTGSGRLIYAGLMGRVSELTEKRVDEFFAESTANLERQLADPDVWANYDAAAIAGRIGEAEAHNAPVKERREAEYAEEHSRRIAEEQELQAEKQRWFDSRVDKIAKAVESGETVSVGFKWDRGYVKNPVLELFKLYGVDIPLRTQGWVNTGLSEITPNGYRYYSNNGKRPSTVFGDYLAELRTAIKQTPIEQKRGKTAATPETEAEAGPQQKEGETAVEEKKITVENKLHDKLTELFPDFMGGKYSCLKLESHGYEPLSLEWIGAETISVMHTYKMNGDLMYDPMMTFAVDAGGKTLRAESFEQSMPPLYQVRGDGGEWQSVDGNGNQKTLHLDKSVGEFSKKWFANLAEQGYIPVFGNLVRGEDNEIRVAFDKDGNMIEPEPETGNFALDEAIEKQYDLGCGFLGNGITVWNKADMNAENDYKTVAHINTDRTVDFYDKDMPDEVKAKITRTAESPDTWAFGFDPAPDKPKEATLDLSLPDPARTVAEMNEYGYTEQDMYPLSVGRAIELFDAGHTIYLLCEDNTEVMVFDRDEIITFSNDGFCGITKTDWEMSPIRDAQNKVYENVIINREQIENKKESDLIHSREPMFGIYQVRDDLDAKRDFRFVPMRELEALGLSVDRENYALVYTAPFSEQLKSLSDRFPMLDRIYAEFNINHPAGYTGRSVSVSDVIVLKYDNSISAHYVDSAGFVSIAGFVGNENLPALIVENPEQKRRLPEAGAKEGKPVSPADLSKAEHKPAPKCKSSLLARLEDAKQQAGQAKQPATAANKKERGYE